MNLPRNRAARREALRRLNLAARRGHAEAGTVNAFCAWPKCRQPVALGAPDIQTASALVRQHYRDRHGGEEPPP